MDPAFEAEVAAEAATIATKERQDEARLRVKRRRGQRQLAEGREARAKQSDARLAKSIAKDQKALVKALGKVGADLSPLSSYDLLLIDVTVTSARGSRDVSAWVAVDASDRKAAEERLARIRQLVGAAGAAWGIGPCVRASQIPQKVQGLALLAVDPTDEEVAAIVAQMRG